MSVGTLQSAGMGAPLTSVMPFRILNKGPEYFRRQVENGARKPSAVERLEADKAKYVKSKQVVSTRQEPVRPVLSRQPLFSPGVRRVLLTPNRRCSPTVTRGDNRGAKNSLNLEILNNLINICDSPLTSPRADKVPWQDAEKPQNSSTPSTPVSHRTPGTTAVRRVDVRPGDAPHPSACPDILITLAVESPAKSCLPTDSPLYSPAGTPNEKGKKQTLLHRSKSDLSDRYSRASADLERFFNYCGLDPGEVSNIGAEHLVRASSDIVSVKFHSVSAESSEYAQSQVSAGTPEETTATTRIPYGISIIERNARVIKWLYGLRQAREVQKLSA
ncbi:protein FAM110A [Bufo bufo]|uniref:protein FAM110A n=1 Tax=Bufo bufo TaxID=8384 RepID=UPI001ABE708C|nr:protein FAM110A [Bufo bufo]XP_040293118.1 protein FAM110A [Bufo bufo]